MDRKKTSSNVAVQMNQILVWQENMNKRVHAYRVVFTKGCV